MAITKIKVKKKKSINLAEADLVPPVMIIAGPNGVGKSTLLFAIKEGNHETDGVTTRIFYQGPHRVIRKTHVRRGWLGGAFRGFLNLLEGNDVSGYEGLNIQNPTRSPDNVDEAGSTIKYTLGKIENKRQSLVTGTIDKLKRNGNRTEINSIPTDIYEPLKTLTKYLLPHLSFSKIDFANEEDIKCLWERKDYSGPNLVDIDDLSSGEKSIVVLFLPLIEDQIQLNLKKLETFGQENVAATEVVEDRLVLIDEPELHLHPDLQAKILTYIRAISNENRTQFIITTHSPTILDQAFDSELYVLGIGSENPDENQLRKIATNAERLEALKQLAGSTYFLTTGRVIVCIEGERDSDPEKPTDARLLEILYPRATAVTLVPTTGKGNVINTVERLRDHVPEATFRIRVRGLVDADQSATTITGIEKLPVCMIENLLLDPASIHEYCQSIGLDTFADENAVKTELKRIAAELKEKEISLRVRKQLKARMVRFDGATIEQIKVSHASELAEINAMLPDDEALTKIVTETTETVNQIIATDTELDQFRGKNMLEVFHSRHIAPRNIGYNPTCIEIAKNVAKKGTVASRLDPIFDRLLAN